MLLPVVIFISFPILIFFSLRYIFAVVPIINIRSLSIAVTVFVYIFILTGIIIITPL